LKPQISKYWMVFLLAGCTAAPTIPPISEFSDTMSGIVKRGAASASFADSVAKARRADFAAAGVVYSLSDRSVCDFTQPSVIVEVPNYKDGCRLEPLILDQVTDEPVPAASVFDTAQVQIAALEKGGQVVQTSDEPLLKKYLAALLRDDLLAYATQLKALAESKLPSELNSSVSVAFDSVANLKDTIDSAVSANGASKPSANRAPTRDLLALLATELAEAKRYSLLKKIIKSTDPTIKKAAVQLGILSFEQSKEELESFGDQLVAAVNRNVETSEGNLKSIEDAYSSAVNADSKAEFRRFVEIAQAHGAILAALEAPRDLEALAAATDRIKTLSDAVKAAK